MAKSALVAFEERLMLESGPCRLNGGNAQHISADTETKYSYGKRITSLSRVATEDPSQKLGVVFFAQMFSYDENKELRKGEQPRRATVLYTISDAAKTHHDKLTSKIQG